MGNRSIIIFGSRHGSAQRYAGRLSEITGIEAVSYKDAREIFKKESPSLI